MKNIIFLGPPASGKGTESKLVKEKYGIPHISTGDLLREAALEDSELGRDIKNKMANGLLIEDKIVTELLEKRLREPDCDNGYILDGYPRTVEQAKIYEEILIRTNKELGYVLYIDTSKEVAIERMNKRIQDAKGPRRDDDNIEIFEKRFDEYISKTKPLIDYYQSKGILYTIDGSMNIEDTFHVIEKIIEN
jgi:adenylate kinase